MTDRSDDSAVLGDGVDPHVAVEIVVNGEPMQVDGGATVADLLRRLDRDPRVLAVERNCDLVRRKLHGETRLEAGDRIEIVTLVGGG